MAVSLLSSQKGTHRVVVVLRRIEVDSSRRRVPVEYGRVLCTGRIQAASSSDVERLAGSGVSVVDTMRFITGQFPGDDLSLVVDGDVTYEVVGAPRRHRGSRRTARDVVYLTAEHQQRRT